MIVIGLTGNIASGKSTVAKMLEQLGAKLVDADRVVHEQMMPGEKVWSAIVKEFGPEVLNPDQTINRPKLGSIVFIDEAALKRLEAITHPAALRGIREKIEQFDGSLMVVEAVKLFEAGWHVGKDSLWVVMCSPQTQLERMMRDRGMTEDDARARLGAQPSLEEKLHVADVVIDNSGTREETFAQVQKGLEKVLARNRG
ncbi:MAG: dephospho-CoA kinase [Chloroflexi bacterium]|nr:dephospho-CoA kinase [Chloroflexota bacterium]